MSTHYTCELYRSIDDVNLHEWRDVCQSSGNLYLDARFLKAVELSFTGEAQIWYAIYRDDAGNAMAATCFSRCFIDGALSAPPFFRKLISGVRRILPWFFRFNILLCGIPIQACCNSQLAISDGADIDGIMAGLDEVAMRLARQSGWIRWSRFLLFLQFPPELAEKLDGLERFGFHKARSAYAYRLEGEFGSFAGYLNSLDSKARRNVRRSLQTFEKAGLTCEQIRGCDGADQLFTPEVYELYLNVLNRAEVRFECVPAGFFKELARQLPNESCFTILRKGDRIVAFHCALAGGEQHALLLVGLDYSLNAEFKLYFNLMFRGLEQGLVPGVQVVHFGASADDFKQGVGCGGSWLTLYLKAVDPPVRPLLKLLFRRWFDSSDGTNAPPPSRTPTNANLNRRE
jgi:predicted N-acyltransferase